MRGDKIVLEFNIIVRYGRKRDLEDIMEMLRLRAKERAEQGGKRTRITKKYREWWLEHLTASRTNPKDPTITLVAEVEGRARGILVLKKTGSDYPMQYSPWWIWVVGVTNGYRNCGLGTALVQSALFEAKRVWGAKKIGLHVVAQNTYAVRLYRNCGFRKVKLIKNNREWNGKRVDSLFMLRHL
jgi:RimJ/RimL family protein N-acetyltransferase